MRVTIVIIQLQYNDNEILEVGYTCLDWLAGSLVRWFGQLVATLLFTQDQLLQPHFGYFYRTVIFFSWLIPIFSSERFFQFIMTCRIFRTSSLPRKISQVSGILFDAIFVVVLSGYNQCFPLLQIKYIFNLRIRNLFYY